METLENKCKFNILNSRVHKWYSQNWSRACIQNKWNSGENLQKLRLITFLHSSIQQHWALAFASNAVFHFHIWKKKLHLHPTLHQIEEQVPWSESCSVTWRFSIPSEGAGSAIEVAPKLRTSRFRLPSRTRAKNDLRASPSSLTEHARAVNCRTVGPWKENPTSYDYIMWMRKWCSRLALESWHEHQVPGAPNLAMPLLLPLLCWARADVCCGNSHRPVKIFMDSKKWIYCDTINLYSAAKLNRAMRFLPEP